MFFRESNVDHRKKTREKKKSVGVSVEKLYVTNVPLFFLFIYSSVNVVCVVRNTR